MSASRELSRAAGGVSDSEAKPVLWRRALDNIALVATAACATSAAAYAMDREWGAAVGWLCAGMWAFTSWLEGRNGRGWRALSRRQHRTILAMVEKERRAIPWDSFVRAMADASPARERPRVPARMATALVVAGTTEPHGIPGRDQ